MVTNKKYIAFSLFFVVSLSLHSFVDHDHFDHSEESLVECQACEENVDVKLSFTKDASKTQKVPLKTSLFKRFVSFNKKSNLSRAPPYKS
tara:strand:- start:1525 stop:1794 length:270 start_codon:yes stop_codon:yes gene_type:complete